MQKTIQHSHYIYNQKLIHVFACYFIGCGYNAPVWCVCVVWKMLDAQNRTNKVKNEKVTGNNNPNDSQPNKRMKTLST